MTLFWILSAAMIAAALGLLAPTLLRKYAKAGDATEQTNVAIAREHLRELTKQKEAGDLSDEEFAQAKLDLEKALAQDLAGTDGADSAAGDTGGGRLALLLSALLIPLIAIPTYLEIGSPQFLENGGEARVASTAPHAAGEMPSMPELARQLEERLAEDSENAEGWFLLGRTYMQIERYADAARAFERVVELMPNEAVGLLSAADALTMANGRRSPPNAVGYLERALEIEPDSVTALWLLGNARQDAGDPEAAVPLWQKAYPKLDDEPEMQAELGRMIKTAGGTVPTSPRNLPSIMSPASPEPVAAQATVAQPEPVVTDPMPASSDTSQQAVEGASIRVQVALAPALFDQADPGDTVFVLARAENGPPMPLAVARHSIDDLPLDVTLSDAMAMMPAMKLSSFPRVKITAQVSKSGRAGTQPGDLTAEDIVVDSAQPPAVVQLLIDEVVR